MSDKKYIGPVTGRTYDLENGDRVDVEAEGIGYTGQHKSPNPYVQGKMKFKRIFIRLRTPYETLTCNPIRDGEDFSNRVSIIENWFNSTICNGNFVLTFEAQQISDEEADIMEKGGEA